MNNQDRRNNCRRLIAYHQLLSGIFEFCVRINTFASIVFLGGRISRRRFHGKYTSHSCIIYLTCT